MHHLPPSPPLCGDGTIQVVTRHAEYLPRSGGTTETEAPERPPLHPSRSTMGRRRARHDMQQPEEIAAGLPKEIVSEIPEEIAANITVEIAPEIPEDM